MRPLAATNRLGHSMREILAAWACCSLVGLGALLIAERDRTAIAVYAGVHIPARSESTAPGLSMSAASARAVWDGERRVSMQGSRGVSTLGCRQPPTSIAFCLRGGRFPVARAGKTRDPGLETTGNPVNVG